MASAPTLLRPVLSLVGWTFFMEGWMYATRIPAINQPNVKITPQMTKEEMNKQLPAIVRWKANAYDHLHEAPTRFYAIALTIALIQSRGLPYPTTTAMETETNLAWAYVALRIAHSLVYATTNRIMVRFGLYLLSEAAMLGMLYKAVRFVF